MTTTTIIPRHWRARDGICRLLGEGVGTTSREWRCPPRHGRREPLGVVIDKP
jgi:hypothetical protein